MSDSASTDKPFIIAKTIAAPIQTVWQCWTQAENLNRWFVPQGLPLVYSTLNLEPEGVYHYGVQTPDGGAMWVKWQFKLIDEPKQLVWQFGFTDETGKLITHHPYSPNWPLRLLCILNLQAFSLEETTLRLEVMAIDMSELERQTWNTGFEGMSQGWHGILEQLALYVLQSASVQ